MSGEGESNRSFSPGIEAPRVADGIFEQFSPAPIHYGEGADGLPLPSIRQKISSRVPLTHTTLVCMADRRAFVIRDSQRHELARFQPEEVEQEPDGTWSVAAPLAIRRLALASGARGLLVGLRGALRTRVEPVRPACAHYGRQFVDLDESSDSQMMERLCMRRASDDGIPLSVMDSAMYACDFRSPPDPETARRMDGFDDKRIAAGEERLREEAAAGDTFDVEAALDSDAARAVTGSALIARRERERAHGMSVEVPFDEKPSAAVPSVSVEGIFDRRNQ